MMALAMLPASTATSKWQPMVDTYVNFGASASKPDTYNCSKWVDLFDATGTAEAPGAPIAKGATQLNDDCEGTRGLFQHLTAYSTGIYPVGTSRVAFSWEIVGTLNSSGAFVHVPAITTWQMNSDGKILHGQDFFDPSSLM